MATRILFFGSLRDVAGECDRLVKLPAHIKDRIGLIQWLAENNDPLKAALMSPEIRMCVDKRIVRDETALDGPEEIGFLPPFSGG